MAASANAPLQTADGRPLKAALATAQSAARRRAFFLVLPLLLFIVVTFIFPIGQMLMRSVSDPRFIEHVDLGTGDVTPIMVELRAWFDDNPQGTEPDEAAYAALVTDLMHLREIKAQGNAGTRINYVYPGARSMFTGGARKARRLEAPFKDAVLDMDEDWADPALWQTMRSASSRYTADFYLAAIDRERNADGAIQPVEEERAIDLLLR